AGIFIVRQRQLAAQASAPAGVCTPTGNANAMAPLSAPGMTLHVTLPAGEPRVVATVNGDPLYAEGLEQRVAAALANDLHALQQAEAGSLRLSLLANRERTSNQVCHDALTQMIQECLLLQEGKRLGLTASLAAAQAMGRQQLQLIHSSPASDPGRVEFETYLRVNHLTEQTFQTDPRVLQGYVDSLTVGAVEQHIRQHVPPGQSPASGISAYVEHLWQIGQVHVYLPAQLGW